MGNWNLGDLLKDKRVKFSGSDLGILFEILGRVLVGVRLVLFYVKDGKFLKNGVRDWLINEKGKKNIFLENFKGFIN